ncbi:MAG: DNA polymerase I [Actinomycetes bacterium]
MGTYLLLDGHSLAYRAFYALPADLATSSGQVTNAAYGFTAMLAKVVGDLEPDGVAVAFDTSAPTFRKDKDESYKAGRKETPDLFRQQLPIIQQVLETLAIPVIEAPGFEADDVIATLATQGEVAGHDVVVVTGDRDSYQLVRDPHIRVLYNKRGVSDYALYDEAGILERTGVTAAQYPEYAALRGDPSDNLPGVPGIGEKTAAKLVTTYGDLDGIFANLDALPPKQRTNLAEWQEQVRHNHDMSVLRRDVPLAVGIEDTALRGFEVEPARALFQQLEFRTLFPRVLAALRVEDAGGHEVEALDVEVEIVHDVATAAACIGGIGSTFACEPVWSGARARSTLDALAIATAERVVVVLHDALTSAEVTGALVRCLEAGPLVAHGAKELLHGLRRTVDLGPALELPGLAADTALMAYLIDPGEGAYDLEHLAGRHLGVELRGPDREEGTLDLDPARGLEDAGRRAAAVLRLADTLDSALAEREQGALLRDVELPIVPILADMEDLGVRIDVDFLAELSRDLTAACARHEAAIHRLAGEPFNVNSTPQLRKVLFETLGLHPVKKTGTGQPSTDADSLQRLAGEHPIVEEILRYREVEKLRNTYADALPPLVAPDGRIHATLNQLSTATGRISSENPNLQNIPIRTEEGRALRKAFIAADGCGLLSADYSQIELRILAHLAEDPGLIDAFERDIDIHVVTAARVFGVAEDAVDPEQRRFAKVVNYGLAYGMEAYGLAQRLDIPNDRARDILDAYFDGFPAVRAFMDHTVAEAKERGYTTTLLGRRRRIPELASDNFRIRQMGERMAQNAPVQGSAADVFKVAMVGLARALREEGLASRMVLTVHDELVLEVPFDERAAAERVTRAAMEGAVDLRVPLVVDMGFGVNWAETK